MTQEKNENICFACEGKFKIGDYLYATRIIESGFDDENQTPFMLCEDCAFDNRDNYHFIGMYKFCGGVAK